MEVRGKGLVGSVALGDGWWGQDEEEKVRRGRYVGSSIICVDETLESP